MVIVRSLVVKLPVLLIVGASLLAGCRPIDDEPEFIRERVEMWASGASASSIGDPASTDFSEIQATGAPNVVGCGDDPNSWSPSSADPSPGVDPSGDTIDDFIELTFPDYVWVHQIKIYESFNPGAVVAVDVETADGTAEPLPLFENFSGNGPAACPSAFVITVNEDTTPEQFNRVVIYLDSNLVGDNNGLNGNADDYNEIDAVQLIGDLLVPNPEN